MNRQERHNALRDLIILSFFGAMMVISDQIMNFLPNVHLIAMFTVLLTRFYRAKALISVYIFVILDGVLEGFYISTWIMYLYIWAILWAIVMLLPKKLPRMAEAVLYPVIGALHGITFGLLTSPPGYFLTVPKAAQSVESYLSYLAVAFPFDVTHMIGNILSCLLVLPLLEFMRSLRAKKKI